MALSDSGRELAQAATDLDATVRKLRKECPWDREQDERSIVPHTLEEVNELVDAVLQSDDAKTVDELGDVLFQVYFLALLLEERGRGDLTEVVNSVHDKLVRRHPHIFGEVEADTVDEVRANWNRIKAKEPGRKEGVFGEVPAGMPALLYADKLLRRAVQAGLVVGSCDRSRSDLEAAFSALSSTSDTEKSAVGEAVGELLFAAVGLARELGVSAELELRDAANRFRSSIETKSESKEQDESDS